MTEKAYYINYNGAPVTKFHLGHPEEFEPFCQIKQDFENRGITNIHTNYFDPERVCKDCLSILKLIESL